MENILNEIIEEIEKLANEANGRGFIDYRNGLYKAVEIINKNRAEVKQDTIYKIPEDVEKKMREALDLNEEFINHPKHYNNYSVEVIDMMRLIYGDERTSVFCEMNAFKYRMRMGTKPENPIEQDLDKENWYLKKSKELNQKK